MEDKKWRLTINMIDDHYDSPLESMCLELDNIKDCAAVIEIFKSNGVLFSKEVYYQFILE